MCESVYIYTQKQRAFFSLQMCKMEVKFKCRNGNKMSSAEKKKSTHIAVMIGNFQSEI